MTVLVKRIAGTSMQHQVSIRGHHFITDEGADNGGDDNGPNPHDLYDSALGACKALTVIWYAKKKGIAVENVEATVERDASKEAEGIYRLTVRMLIEGDFSAEQHKKMLSIAERCPVHNLMTKVETQIVTIGIDRDGEVINP